MRKLAVLLVLSLVVGVGVTALWPQRMELALRLAVALDNLRNPVADNRPVTWQQGTRTDTASKQPNIVLIVVDDLGFNDLSFYNGERSTLPTPDIDALAAQGVAFDNAYAGNAVCAPSRAMLMTGRYSTRFGFEYTPAPVAIARMFDITFKDSNALHKPQINMAGVESMPPFETLGMPSEEVTLAELLRAQGYHTVHIGKWHLGRGEGMRPEHQGFNESLLMESGLYLPADDPQVVNARQDFDPLDQALWLRMRYAASYNGGELFEPRGYLTDYYTEEAVKVIEANRNRPFFLYLAHWGVHSPLQALKTDYDALSHIEDHRLRVYSAMLRALDRSVRQVRKALQENGIDDNTLVIFTSDNGAPGYLGLPELNAPYRGWKLTLFEGGVHVPLFMRWPEGISAGSRLTHPVSHLDIFSTVAAATGATLPDDRIVDGVDLLPHISGRDNTLPHDIIFWRQGHYQGARTQHLKFMRSDNPDKVWLFDLTADPLEQKNIAEQHPAVVKQFERKLAEHNAGQSPSRWPSIASLPVLIDKTSAQPAAPDDEYVYWPN